MMKLFAIVLSTLLFSSIAVAESEDWYFNLSLGLANKKNPDSVEQVLLSAENNMGTDRVTIAVDYGLYWSVFDETMLLGLVSNSSVDSVQDNNFNEEVAHDLEYFGISTIIFLGESLGQGVFIRGDLGNATATYRYSNSSSIIDDGSGSATLIGIGNSFAFTGNRTRIIVSLNTILINIDDREYNSNQVMIGFMW